MIWGWRLINREDIWTKIKMIIRYYRFWMVIRDSLLMIRNRLWIIVLVIWGSISKWIKGLDKYTIIIYINLIKWFIITILCNNIQW